MIKTTKKEEEYISKRTEYTVEKDGRKINDIFLYSLKLENQENEFWNDVSGWDTESVHSHETYEVDSSELIYA